MDIHKYRKQIDELIFDIEQSIKNEEKRNSDQIRAESLVRTKLQEAKMWSGKILEARDKPLPKEYRDNCDRRGLAPRDN